MSRPPLRLVAGLSIVAGLLAFVVLVEKELDQRDEGVVDDSLIAPAEFPALGSLGEDVLSQAVEGVPSRTVQGVPLSVERTEHTSAPGEQVTVRIDHRCAFLHLEVMSNEWGSPDELELIQEPSGLFRVPRGMFSKRVAADSTLFSGDFWIIEEVPISGEIADAGDLIIRHPRSAFVPSSTGMPVELSAARIEVARGPLVPIAALPEAKIANDGRAILLGGNRAPYRVVCREVGSSSWLMGFVSQEGQEEGCIKLGLPARSSGAKLELQAFAIDGGHIGGALVQIICESAGPIPVGTLSISSPDAIYDERGLIVAATLCLPENGVTVIEGLSPGQWAIKSAWPGEGRVDWSVGEPRLRAGRASVQTVEVSWPSLRVDYDPISGLDRVEVDYSILVQDFNSGAIQPLPMKALGNIAKDGGFYASVFFTDYPVGELVVRGFAAGQLVGVERLEWSAGSSIFLGR